MTSAGVLDRRSGEFIRFTRTAGGATVAPEEHLDPVAAEAREGQAWVTAVEEHELLDADGADHDQESFLAGQTTPVLFSSAVQNFGVGQLLNVLLELAPAPTPRPTADGGSRALDEPFSAFVFKMQAGMNAAHRDRIAFARVCSGVFERGMVATHEPTGRPFATKYAQAVFGRERTTLDTAYPGDVIGLVNAASLGIGDTLYVDEPVRFPPLPSFAPEHFAVARAKDSGRYKQFRRGITQLEQEGVVQVLRSELRGDQAPVLAAVGPMQFEVATHRMTHEFNAPIHLRGPRLLTCPTHPTRGHRRTRRAAHHRGADPRRRRAPRPVPGPMAAAVHPTRPPRPDARAARRRQRLTTTAPRQRPKGLTT